MQIEIKRNYAARNVYRLNVYEKDKIRVTRETLPPTKKSIPT